MTTMTAEDLSNTPGAVRAALARGDEVRLTYHGKPYARVIADDRGQVENQRAELEQLRAEVAALRGRLEQVAV